MHSPIAPGPPRVPQPGAPANIGGNFDIGAFAALAGLGPTKAPKPRAPGERPRAPEFPPGGDLAALLGGLSAPGPPGPTISGAINAEDLEASLLGSPPAPPQGPPPGFGAIQLGHILSQLGPPVGPQIQSVEEMQMMQRHLASLGLGPLGPPLPGQELLGGPMAPGRHPSGDPLGIQSLANLGPPVSGPMMMPMLPFGLPPMGLLPFSQAPTGLQFGSSPPRLPPRSSTSPPPSSSPLLPPWPPAQSTLFGPVPPFSRGGDTGFPSSVLFPGDLRHPLSQAPGPRAGGSPEPGPGSPITPPNIDIHTFDFED